MNIKVEKRPDYYGLILDGKYANLTTTEGDTIKILLKAIKKIVSEANFQTR